MNNSFKSDLQKFKIARCWCLMPAILATQEAEIRRNATKSQPGWFKRSYLKKPITKKCSGSRCGPLVQTPLLKKKKKKSNPPRVYVISNQILYIVVCYIYIRKVNPFSWYFYSVQFYTSANEYWILLSTSHLSKWQAIYCYIFQLLHLLKKL
jgi:hypothetical protein